MNRIVRTVAVLVTTAGVSLAGAGSAYAHYCFKLDKTANRAAANSGVWLDKEEASAALAEFNAMVGGACSTELAAVEAFLAEQPDTWRLLLSGLLAGGTEGTERTPEHFGYSLEVVGPFFGCLEERVPQG